ncbi:MAG: single-stranded DNA-binding protein [Synergistaceae bacterium]|nr:single-stranded DNA-binding protein [Synergistaceae bacterium]
MRGFNRAIIAGNLTRDPDLRYTVNKKAYARFTVAVSSTWKNANGEVQENTDYINVVAWGAMAETCGKYLKKGSPVLIEGRIKTGSYDAKDGSGKRYTTEIYADNMVMLGSREGGQDTGFQQRQSGSSSPYNMPVPSDDDFGKSIGESGFGGGGFTPGFAGGNSGIPDNMDDSGGIPF